MISEVKVAKLIAPLNFLHATTCMFLPSKLPPKYERQDRRRTTMTALRVVVLATTLPKRNLFARRSLRASTHRFLYDGIICARPQCLIYWRILSQRSAAAFFYLIFLNFFKRAFNLKNKEKHYNREPSAATPPAIPPLLPLLISLIFISSASGTNVIFCCGLPL